jgi:hypothetical protein
LGNLSTTLAEAVTIEQETCLTLFGDERAFATSAGVISLPGTLAPGATKRYAGLGALCRNGSFPIT